MLFYERDEIPAERWLEAAARGDVFDAAAVAAHGRSTVHMLSRHTGRRGATWFFVRSNKRNVSFRESLTLTLCPSL